MITLEEIYDLIKEEILGWKEIKNESKSVTQVKLLTECINQAEKLQIILDDYVDINSKKLEYCDQRIKSIQQYTDNSNIKAYEEGFDIELKEIRIPDPSFETEGLSYDLTQELDFSLFMTETSELLCDFKRVHQESQLLREENLKNQIKALKVLYDFYEQIQNIILEAVNKALKCNDYNKVEDLLEFIGNQVIGLNPEIAVTKLLADFIGILNRETQKKKFYKSSDKILIKIESQISALEIVNNFLFLVVLSMSEDSTENL